MKVFAKYMASLLVIFGLSACGGGGSISRDDDGGGGTPTTPTVTYSIALGLYDATSGNAVDSSTELTSAQPLTVRATISASDGSSVSGQVVAFSFDEENLAEFSVANGRVATNSNGVAEIDLTVGENSGAGNVIATFGDQTAQIAFTSAGQSTVTEQPASLTLFADSLQLPSSGSDDITITALVKNANNSLMEGVTVNFSADSGNLIGGTETTNAEGQAMVTLNTQGDPENRFIEVTAVTGTSTPLTSTIRLQVVGTQIVVNAPESVVLNDSAPLTFSILDSDGNPVGDQTITLESQLGDIDNLTPVTSASGVATVTYTATQSGTDTITATALSTGTSKEITVGQDQFTFVVKPAEGDEIDLGQTETLTVEWLKDGVAYQGGNISVSASRGVISNADVVTGSDGRASFDISSNNAGTGLITVTGEDNLQNIVTARATVEFIATTPASIAVDATPDTIGPNGQEATIFAVVRDASGNRVKDVDVEFVLDDVSNGNISQSAVKTDSNGSASVVYTSNTTSSVDGVTITATVSTNQSITDSTSLTVSDRAFDISFGIGNTLEEPNDSTYRAKFSVFVADSSGNPVPNVELSSILKPVKSDEGDTFYKGYTSYNTLVSRWEFFTTASCQSEDADGDGMLDQGEDLNGDGELSPGIVGVLYFEDGVSTTDATGQAVMVYDYPQNFGGWAQMRMGIRTISAGTESTASFTYLLGVSASDIANANAKVPDSPWGISNSCFDMN